MIKLLNKYGIEIRNIEFIELQWTRKYHECGSFVLYMAAKDYSPDIKYIQLKDRPETGMVQKVVYEKKTNGDFVTLSGFFVEKQLDNGMLITDVLRTGLPTAESTAQFIKMLLWMGFRQYTNDLDLEINNGQLPSHIRLGSADCLYRTVIDESSEFFVLDSQTAQAEKPLGSFLYNLLQGYNYSYYCLPEWQQDESKPLLGLMLKSYKGRDLRDKVYFGKAWGSVKNIDYVIDESKMYPKYVAIQILDDKINYTDMIFVNNEGQFKKAIVEFYQYDGNCPHDLGKCIPTKVIYTNATNIEADKENYVRSQMQQAMKLDMLNNYKIEHISADVLQNRFLYLKDYDLGDICTVVIDEIKQMYTARIVEVREVWAKNKVDVEIVLGTPQKQKYRKVMV